MLRLESLTLRVCLASPHTQAPPKRTSIERCMMCDFISSGTLSFKCSLLVRMLWWYYSQEETDAHDSRHWSLPSAAAAALMLELLPFNSRLKVLLSSPLSSALRFP